MTVRDCDVLAPDPALADRRKIVGESTAGDAIWWAVWPCGCRGRLIADAMPEYDRVASLAAACANHLAWASTQVLEIGYRL